MSAPSSTEAPEAQVIRNLFEAADARDADRSAAFLADDLYFRFSNAEPLEGREAFRDMAREFNASIAGIRHEIKTLWLTDADGVVVTELAVHYERLDGARLTLPCCNVFQLDEEMKVKSYKIFMDITPVFAERDTGN